MHTFARYFSDWTSSRRFSFKILPAAALALLVLSAYVSSISGDFVYDDQRVVLANPVMEHKDWQALAAIFTRDYWGAYHPNNANAPVESSYYRPFIHVYELVAFALVGKSGAGWHLISILLHALAAILVMLVLDKSLEAATSLPQKSRRLLALFAAAIFAVHPVQGEAVAWISAFANPLGAIFSLSAFYCYLIYRDRRKFSHIALASLLLAAALLTKEIAAIGVLLIAAHELFIFNRQSTLKQKLRSAAKPVIAFGVVTGAYLAVRYAVLHGIAAEGRNLNFPEDDLFTLTDTIRTLPSLVTTYLRLAIMPFGHSMMYDFSYVRSFLSAGFWLPLCFLSMAGALLVWGCKRVPELRIAAVWMVIPLLPHLNTRVFASEEIVHDRYLYLSMVGVAFLLAVAAYKSADRLRLSSFGRLSFAAVILAALCISTITQNTQWQNEGILWLHAAAHAPHSRIPHLALGVLAESRQDYDCALAEYTAALNVNPDTLDALNNQAFVYAKLGWWDKAMANFEKIVGLTPNKAIAHLNLSVAYGAQQRAAEAAVEKQKAVDLDLQKSLDALKSSN